MRPLSLSAVTVALAVLLGLVLCCSAQASVLSVDGVWDQYGQMFVPSPTGDDLSTVGNSVSASETHVVWVDKKTTVPADTYRRIYGYRLDADDDGDDYPNLLAPEPDQANDRPPAVALTANGSACEGPDIYDDRVVYAKHNGTDWDIKWQVFGGTEYNVCSDAGHQLQPRISKSGGTYYVVWEDRNYTYYRVRWRALPSTPGDCTSTVYFTSETTRHAVNPDVGGPYIVWEAQGYRLYLSTVTGGNNNKTYIQNSGATSTLPCTDGDLIAYLEGTTYENRNLYAVRVSDAGTAGQRVLLATGTDYHLVLTRPGVANGVVAFVESMEGGGGCFPVRMANFYLSDMADYKNAGFRPIWNALWAGMPGSGNHSGYWFPAMAGDIYCAGHGINPLNHPSKEHAVGYLRSNFPDRIQGDGAQQALLIHAAANPDSRLSYTAKVFLRNFTDSTWTSSYSLRRLSDGGTYDWGGWAHVDNPYYPVNTTYDWDVSGSGIAAPSTAPQKAATFQWTFEAPPKAGRYAFDFGMYYNGWLSHLSYSDPSGSETEYVDLLRHRQDLWFRSFVDVPAASTFWPMIEACHWHWADVSKPRIVLGYANGTFDPDAAVNRDAMCVYVYRAEQSPAYTPPACGYETFDDVSCTYWAYKEIEWCASQGIVLGYGDGTFRPGNACSRAAACVYLTRALDGDEDYEPASYYYTDPTYGVPSTYWAAGSIYWMSDQKHLRNRYGGTAFYPDRTIQRQEMCEFVTYGYRLTLPTKNDQTPW